MKDTATVKIFLAQGSPTSVRTAELSNWTGKAVAGPRSQIEEILKREEANNPGVYFLTGVNPETGRDKVYIGEAEVIRKRIKGHMEKDFWKTIVFFVSKDENLTKAHIKYLEGKLIETAKSVGRFELENAQSSGSHLPESDAADMDIFLFRMEQLLPILGQEFLKPVVKQEVIKKSDLLFCEIKNLKATGRQTDNGLVILKDSEAVLEERPSTQKYLYAANLRKTLLNENIVEKRDDRLVFISDYEFSSPSAAAAVIHGGQANGLTSWKDSKGISLKQKEEKDIQQLNALDS
ncbi:MAG: GIY-YIG nuclease family protein [Candidatus Scalindua rubra]|uniref:GIY-YIG catalytic domain protein n=1 Tax=Candidatus Scalindua brodae TaxID=237368 RepID=A0A0B0EER5_9BACT|nr:MAG: GIY-YIG catalytic domain protein [Candidatus Scalindua brodae]MBZ0110643.1 GIY-YIG nuclease family protein [Candidatus Scalindua rubra]TWU28936.1 GIY-YIG catalytic domain protein [Candidatus Brocadiaceae bacterium S225]